MNRILLRCPLLLMGATFLFSFLLSGLSVWVAGVLLLLFFLGLLCLAFRKPFSARAAAIMLLGMLAAVIAPYYSYRDTLLLSQYGGKTETFFFTVTDASFDSEESRYIVKTKDGFSLSLTGSSEWMLQRGERGAGVVSVYEDSPYLYFRGQGVSLSGRLLSFEATASPPFLETVLSKLRYHWTAALHTVFLNEEAAILSAMLLGERERIDDIVSDAFSLAGFSHILCVSGLHLSLILQGLRKVLKKWIFNPRVLEIISLSTLFFYLLLIGSPPSAVRAFFMAASTGVGRILGSDTVAENSLGGAVLIMTLFSPSLCYNVGFLLSVASVFGIAVLGPRISLPQGKIASSFRSSLAASVMTFPILALSMGYLPLLSPVVNIGAVFLTAPILVTGFFAALFSGTGLSIPFAFVAKGLIGVLTWGAEMLKESKAPLLPLGKGLVLGFSAAAFALFLFSFLLRKRKRLIRCLCAFIFCFGLLAGELSTGNSMYTYTISGEYGNTFIFSRGRECIIVGMAKGNGVETVRFLRSHGIDTVDALILPDEGRDVSADAPLFASRMPVERLIAVKGNSTAAASLYAKETDAFFRGEYLFFGGTLSLYPLKEGGRVEIMTQNERYIVTDVSDPLPLSQGTALFYNP